MSTRHNESVGGSSLRPWETPSVKPVGTVGDVLKGGGGKDSVNPADPGESAQAETAKPREIGGSAAGQRTSGRLLLHLVFETQPPPRHPDREVCVWRDEQGHVFARAFAQGARRWIDWPGLGIFAFAAGSHRVQVWPAATDRDLVAGAFARRLQPIILQALGRQAIHASAVLGRGGVLAFCGVGHSGKSTLAFAMARIGFRQVADDALVLERLESTVSVTAAAFHTWPSRAVAPPFRFADRRFRIVGPGRRDPASERAAPRHRRAPAGFVAAVPRRAGPCAAGAGFCRARDSRAVLR